MSAETPLLELTDVRKSYAAVGAARDQSTIEVIKNVSGVVPEGRFVSIVGPSGCGKSTLLSMVAGLHSVSGGQMLLKGREILAPHPSLGVVFQEDSTFPWLTVAKNVEFALEMQGVSKSDRQARAKQTLDLVGLDGFHQAYPKQLSGGMRQRVAIARALALDPDILLMDEPFGAVDPQTRMFLGVELRRIWRDTGKTVLFITHDLNEAVFLSQEVWVLSRRPSTIIESMTVDLPSDRDMSVLSESTFTESVGHLWGVMQNEWEAGRSESAVSGV